MNARMRTVIVSGILFVLSLHAAGIALANGGPFVVKYPDGDPAAKGILARLTPNLKPAREERLRVIKEDLKVTFVNGPGKLESNEEASNPPLAVVSAEYTIENPTNDEIEIDFGFPILRGLYMSRFSMMPRPDVEVRMNKKKHVQARIISNSAIYGLIRQRAREVIEKAVAEDATLARLVATVRATGMVRRRVRRTIDGTVGKDDALREAVRKDPLLAGLAAGDPDSEFPDHEAARSALAEYLAGPMKWDSRDVALMVEFASLDFGSRRAYPRDRTFFYHTEGNEFVDSNLGPLGAIGEQKATQLFAKLAACFDPDVASTYEGIFSAWGGDVRERSVDLKTGEVRPREITVHTEQLNSDKPSRGRGAHDLTIYARVDYLDPNAKITEAQKASCKAVLKNLPVIFTFAPMNLLHYRVKFPANATQTLTVSYKQYAYKDTADPASYQLAYVVHPASLWKDFGPINLEVAVPENVPLRASVSCKHETAESRKLPHGLTLEGSSDQSREHRFDVYRGTVTEKTGELFLAVNAGAWKDMRAKKTLKASIGSQARR